MDRIFADREPMPLPDSPSDHLSPAEAPPVVSVVVPTLGRPSLAVLLEALAADPPIQMGWELLLVDDRRVFGRRHKQLRGRAASTPLAVPAVTGGCRRSRKATELVDSVPRSLMPYTRILPGHAAGPAAARNTGWRAARAPWIVFLDDDVRPEPAWWRRLPADLAVPADVGGVQGQLAVPVPGHRRPTDWERTTSGLGSGLWITADMAYRRAALAEVGGFDERFPRAFREDSELAHRVRLAGWRLVRGERRVIHPVRPEGPWVSLRAQRGNGDDALLRRMYGPGWRDLLGVPRGRRRSHVATTAAGALALVGAAAIGARHGLGRTPVADGGLSRGLTWIAAAGWLAGTAEFAAARIRPGPRRPAEIATMVATSALIPPVATLHWLRGWIRGRGAHPLATRPTPAQSPPATKTPLPAGAVGPP